MGIGDFPHTCPSCLGAHSFIDQTFHHEPGCPRDPKNKPAVDELALRRLEKIENIEDTPLEVVLDAAKAWIKESGAQHVIVVVGRDGDGSGSATRYFNGGSFHYHAQMGLLWEGAQMIRDSA